MTSPIPTYYRIAFLLIDPIFAAIGVYYNTFNPHWVLNSYTPNAKLPATETTMLLDSATGFVLGIMYLQLVFLRHRQSDLGAWRAVQASILTVDVVLVAAYIRAFIADNRLDFSQLRLDDWTNLAITGGVALNRAAFLLGIGIHDKGKGKVA